MYAVIDSVSHGDAPLVVNQNAVGRTEFPTFNAFAIDRSYGFQRCFCRVSFLFLSCVVPFGTCVLYSSRLSCCNELQLVPLLMASKRLANPPPAPADQRAQGLLQAREHAPPQQHVGITVCS